LKAKKDIIFINKRILDKKKGNKGQYDILTYTNSDLIEYICNCSLNTIFMEINKIRSFFFGDLNLNDENTNVIEKQRAYTFIYGLITLILGITVNLVGISGPQDTFFVYINILHLILTFSIYFLFRAGKISLVRSLSLLFLITEFEIVAEMINCAIHNTAYHIDLILGNMVLLAILQVLILVAYLPRISYVTASATVITFFCCSIITNHNSLINFLPIMALIWLFITWMGIRLIKNVSLLQQEHSGLKDEQQIMFDFLRMDKNQWKAITALAKENKLPPQQTNLLMSLLTINARRNIVDNVKQMIEQESIDYEIINERLPMLAKGEKDICRLILQGKSISEISAILGKTTSNITCRRTKIRAKLGLKKEDNLHEVLIELTKKD